MLRPLSGAELFKLRDAQVCSVEAAKKVDP
jgi:hypothetical protein